MREGRGTRGLRRRRGTANLAERVFLCPLRRAEPDLALETQTHKPHDSGSTRFTQAMGSRSISTVRISKQPVPRRACGPVGEDDTLTISRQLLAAAINSRCLADLGEGGSTSVSWRFSHIAGLEGQSNLLCLGVEHPGQVLRELALLQQSGGASG